MSENVGETTLNIIIFLKLTLKRRRIGCFYLLNEYYRQISELLIKVDKKETSPLNLK